MSVPFPKPFRHLRDDCQSIADKPRKYSQADLHFINDETQRLLLDDLIEPSNSPLRAQVLVVKEQSGNCYMVIDYRRTINRFTQLDAYPLPRIDEIVNELAQHRVFTTVDLKSAYHWIHATVNLQLSSLAMHYISGDASRLVLPMLCQNSNERLITLSENDLKRVLSLPWRYDDCWH